MVKKLSLVFALPPTLLLALTCSSARAVDAPIFVGERHNIPKAVRVEITPRGQKLFESKLNSILGNLGVSLEEGYFPAQTINSEKPIDMDELEKSQPEAIKMYKQVKDMLSQWLMGFSLNPHQPAIQIGESGYVAKFSRFGLVTDQKLMDQLGYRDGAVLAIELEIDSVTMGTSAIKAWDPANAFLGEVQLQDVSISAQKANDKIKIRLPFYVRMNASGLLEFQALEVSQNLDQADITLNYKKLLVPQMGVIINGKTFYMNNEQLEKFVQSQIPTVLEKVREHIGKFAKEQMPQLLNEKAKEKLAGKIEQIQNMEAPGTEPGDRRPPLIWGMTLTELKMRDSLNVALDAFVEDPVNPQSRVAANIGSRGNASINALNKSLYDMGLALDRGMINRVMQLAFQRKNFEKIPQSDGSSLKLVASPTIDYTPMPAGVAVKANETFFKLHVSVETQPDSMWLKDTIVISFDIVTKIRPVKTGKGMELVLYKIDTNSVDMDPSYLSFGGRLFKGKVYEGLKEELAKRSAPWTKKDEVLSGSLPLPPEILGIQTELVQVNMEQTGHLVLYLNFNTGKTGNGVAK